MAMFVLRSCMVRGLIRAGSHFEGVTSTKRETFPREISTRRILVLAQKIAVVSGCDRLIDCPAMCVLGVILALHFGSAPRYERCRLRDTPAAAVFLISAPDLRIQGLVVSPKDMRKSERNKWVSTLGVTANFIFVDSH